ncbi:MAG: S8 family serine peptidase [Candidatus Sericytochromatia bacterium]|nr:S8 family serine peptidase [Candidatus Sericytochromatia bacterium]
MPHAIRPWAVAATLVAGCGNVSAPIAPSVKATAVDGQAIPGEWIVQTRTTAPPAIKGVTVVQTLDLGPAGAFHKIVTQADRGTDTRLALAAGAGVVGVTPNRAVVLEAPSPEASTPGFVMPLAQDPLAKDQWYLPRIGTEAAWSRTHGRGVVAAVVDTGVDYRHPDLMANMASNGVSYADTKADGLDTFGHGTHVAGIIGAVAGNGEGVAGVAPEVKILPVAVLGAKGGGSIFSIAQGIKYAADYGVTNKVRVVINLSLGSATTTEDPISRAAGLYATYKGALPVAAAGNHNCEVGSPARITDYYMAVAATDPQDAKAPFSCFGPQIAVAAPGVDIMNTTPTYRVPLNDKGLPLNYAALKGTSMATPVAAGVAVLVWSQHPEWNWKQVREHVQRTATDLGKAGRDDIYGHGLVNADLATR